MNHLYCVEYKDILLRPLHRYDLERIRQYRNREDLNKYLKQIGKIDNEGQMNWFSKYILDPDICFFSIDYKSFRTIGSLALYEFDNDNCSIGKIVIGNDVARGNHLGRKAFLMAMSIGVNFFHVKEFHCDVHSENIPALKTYLAVGFRKSGEHLFEKGGIEYEMTLPVKRLLSENEEIYSFWLYKENDAEAVKFREGEYGSSYE